MNKMDLGQIFTRRILADYMVSLFTLSPKSVVLDPCFGGGAFLDSIIENRDYSVYGYEIDSELFNSYDKKANNLTLYNADFLLSTISLEYDGIIMNPPYIRHEKIDKMASFGITKDELMKHLVFSKLPRTANIYMYFVVKAISVLKVNGELIVIFPESWLNSKSGTTFRNIISKYCSVVNKIHVNGKAFEKDALVDVIIVKLTKIASFVDCEPMYVEIEENAINKRTMEQFEQFLCHRIPLYSYSTIRRGLTTGFNEIFINPNLPARTKALSDIISSPKSIVGYSTKNAVTDKLLALKKNDYIDENLRKYLDYWETAVLDAGKPKTISEKIKRNKQWYLINDFDCTGIIMGYMIRGDIRFILNESGVTARDNFYIIYPKIDNYVMLSLLNNFYVYMQIETIGRKYGGGMLKLQKYDVESLMLTDLSRISKVDNNKLAKLGRDLAETGAKSVINEITAILSAYETLRADEVTFQYEYIRAKRLEGAK